MFVDIINTYLIFPILLSSYFLNGYCRYKEKPLIFLFYFESGHLAELSQVRCFSWVFDGNGQNLPPSPVHAQRLQRAETGPTPRAHLRPAGRSARRAPPPSRRSARARGWTHCAADAPGRRVAPCPAPAPANRGEESGRRGQSAPPSAGPQPSGKFAEPLEISPAGRPRAAADAAPRTATSRGLRAAGPASPRRPVAPSRPRAARLLRSWRWPRCTRR